MINYIIIIIITTSYAPISSKIKVSGLKQCVSRQWMDEGARKLRRIGSIKQIGF